MRIGLFTDSYPPYINGVSTSVAMLKRALEKKGHIVYVVTVGNNAVKYEYDEEELDYEKLDENTFRISGSVSIFELRRILGIDDIPEGDYDTLSGYLIELLGRIPSDNETPIIETEKVTYKIEDYEDKRILWVKACKNNIPEEQENDEEKTDEE